MKEGQRGTDVAYEQIIIGEPHQIYLFHLPGRT